MSKNELAIVDTAANQILPSAEDIAFIREELQSMDQPPFGRIKIGAAGTKVFQVFGPGDNEDDATSVTEVEGVILMSNKTNGLWLKQMGEGEDKAPDCASTDGITGIRKDTGETCDCETCVHNQFGSAPDGRGKRCKNMRRLFMLRPGDIFPSVLTLPPTAIRPFENYRLKLLTARKHIWGVLTKISLKNEKNASGIAYSVPVFNAAGALSPADAKLVKEYADSFSRAASAIGVTSEDGKATVETRFVQVSNDEAEAIFPPEGYAPIPD